MVVVTGFIAIGTSVAGVFVGATAAAALGAGTLFAIGIATNIVLGAASRALIPKPNFSQSNRGYQTTALGSALDHQIIYGKMRVGGVRIYDEATGTNNKFLHRIIAVAGHEIEAFDDIYIDDEVVTLDGTGNVTSPARYDGKVRILTHLGSPNQVADATLVSESSKWTNEHRLRGIAYMYIRLQFNADTFPNGIPEITSTVSGKKVYDPRTSTTAWSDNPALCLRDYLLANYGLAEEVANIDDTLVIAAANVADQTNTIAGTTRYTCNGAFTTASTPYEMISSLLTSMDGSMWYAQGKWRMKTAYWTAPVLALTEDDLRSSINVSTRHSRRDNFNVVKGTFRGSESNWQTTDYPQVTNSAFLSADGGQESVADVDLPFTDNSIEARRIALISLERNRQQLTVSASFGLRTLEVQVGDNVTLTSTRFGWSNKEFEVVSWNFGLVGDYDLQTNMVLRETAESVYDEVSDGIVYERDNTNLLSPFDVPAVGISIDAIIQVSNQKVSNIAIATITSSRPEGIDHVEVEYRINAEVDYSSFGQGSLGEFRVRDLDVNFYDFRARAVNTFGIRGEFTYLLDVEVNAFAGDPSDVSSLSVELSGGSMFLSWPPIPDADLSHYEVKLNTNTTGATWGNSTTVIEKIARPATTAVLPARSGTILIRAYDKEGNFSAAPTVIVVLPSELPQLGTALTQTEDPSFAGAKTNTAIVSSTLQIDITTASSPTGDYLFSDYIDTAAARNARVTGFKTYTRTFDGGTQLWDDIPQNWDTWPDTWDTWTDNDAAFGDTSVLIYVSPTDDDPAGTPTWGAYTLANGNFIQGRAFRFKAVLSSTSTKFTPAITELSVTVEY
jgi:hypothetical protein